MPNKPHVVVLIHGFLGFASDMAYLEKAIAARDATVHILNSACNEYKTTGGIPVQAERILADLQQLVSTSEQLRNHESIAVSVVGHSLGGLVGRYLLHLLHVENGKTGPVWILRHYISVASPHLGAVYRAVLPWALNAAMHTWWVAGDTGQQMFLADKDHTLLRMCDQEFLDALRACASRVSYACIKWDASVGFETASMVADAQSSMVAWKDETDGTMPEMKVMAVVGGGKVASGEDESVQKMLDALNSLQWTKVVVLPKRPFLAHFDVIVKSEYMNKDYGDSVVQNIVDRLLL